jgi:5'-methylthioadenosine phosphorylase
VVIEGPAFSTKAESLLYRSWEADVIGMTALPEAKLAREAEICYATLALVTDYDTWHESHEPVTAEMILENLNRNVETAKRVVAEAVRALPVERACPCTSALAAALVTPPELVPEETKRMLAPIIGRYMQPEETK